MRKKYPKNKTAQEIQDDIFKKMSADRKLKIGFLLLSLAKDLKEEERENFTAEGLVLGKLKWYRESKSAKDLKDAELVLATSQGMINMKYLKQWAVKLGVKKILDKLL